MARVRRAMGAYAAGVGLTAVTVLLGLWSSRILVEELGRGGFGAARTLPDWWVTLGLLDLGLAGAIAPLLARAHGRDDPEAARSLFKVGVAWAGLASLLALLGGLVVLASLPRLVDAGPGTAGDVRLAWVFLLAALPALWAIPHRAWLEARQQGWRVNLVLTAQAVAIALGSVAAARAGFGVAGQGAAFALASLGFAAAMALMARPPRGPRPDRDARRRARRDLARQAAPTSLLGLCGRLGLMSDVLIVSALLGVERVAALFFTTRLATLAQGQLGMVATSSWPAMAELDARGERALLARRIVELTRLTTILGVAALVPIACYMRHFVALWSPREPVFAGEGIAALASANALGVGMWSLWGWPFAGTNRAREMVAPTAVGMGLNFALSLAITPSLGVAGPLVGTFVPLFLLQLPWLAARLRATFGVRLRDLGAAALWPLLAGTPWVFWCRWAAGSHTPWGWVGLGAEMGFAALGSLATAWLLVLPADERLAWGRRLGFRRASGP